MLIRVTQKHIEEGTREDPHSCPVALAMRDAGVPSPSVLTFTSLIAGKRLDHPDVIADFVEEFDLEFRVRPFSVEFNSLIPHPTKFK